MAENKNLLGAVASNAGDDFHELWALHQSLGLLDANTRLVEVSVEGVRFTDKDVSSDDIWQGVDCALYYGDHTNSTITKIVIAQLKYSEANPDQAWSISAITAKASTKTDSSIIGKLAKAFIGLKVKHANLIDGKNIEVKFISNRPIHNDVLNSLKGENDPSVDAIERTKRESNKLKIKTASCLEDNDFILFVNALNFDECGSGSRHSFKSEIFKKIYELTDSESNTFRKSLLYSIREEVMPENCNHSITRAVVLSWFNVSNEGALFPCPLKINSIKNPVKRSAARTIVDRLLSGEQYLCIHGDGGCGKTTVLQEVRSLLAA